jgi:raffinose/stachyose/melibiose transport system permease protein
MIKKRSNSYTFRQDIVAYALLAPALIMFVYFVCIPAVQTVYISFTQWEGIGPKTFTGLKNYNDMLVNNEVYWISLKNNLIWTVVAVSVPVGIGLFQANLLVRGNIKFAKIYQLIYFLPQIISMVVAAVAWKWIYDPVMGPLNYSLEAVGLGRFATGWLGNPQTVMSALIVVNIWINYGFCCVVFGSAIQSIDKEIYEAAMVDGASRMKQFWNITLPGVRETMTTILLLMMIWSFKVFDIIFTMTKGGPAQSSYVIVLYTYMQGFVYNRMGIASAITVSLTVIMLVLSKAFLAYREKGRY